MYMQTVPVLWTYRTRKYLEVLLLGIGPDCRTSPLLLLCALLCLQPPMLWSTRQVPVAPPGLRRGGGRCSSAPARKRGLGGLLFLLSDSIYMGSSEPGVYYATQAGCEELWRGGGGSEWSMPHHH